MAEPSHLHGSRALPLMQGAETIYAGAQYQRWFCKGCDTITLLPVPAEELERRAFGSPVEGKFSA